MRSRREKSLIFLQRWSYIVLSRQAMSVKAMRDEKRELHNKLPYPMTSKKMRLLVYLLKSIIRRQQQFIVFRKKQFLVSV